MKQPFATIAEEDLHALVDDALDPQRRAQIVADAAASPADAAKVADWQRQNILLRAAFAPVMQEALPPRLGLAARARLAPAQPAAVRSAERRLWPFLAGLALGLCLCLGEALWFAALPDGDGFAALHRFFRPVATENADTGAALARAAQALDRLAAQTIPAAAVQRDGDAATSDLQAQDLSPDLTHLGLRLTSTDLVRGAHGPVGCFNFLGSAGEQAVLCLARRVATNDFDFRNIGEPLAPVIAWQDAAGLYALAGSVETRRLDDLARHARPALIKARNEIR